MGSLGDSMNFSTKNPLQAAREEYYGPSAGAGTPAPGNRTLVFSYASPDQLKQAKLDALAYRMQQRMKGIMPHSGRDDGYEPMMRTTGALDLRGISSLQLSPQNLEVGGIDQFQTLVVPPEYSAHGDERAGTSKFVLQGQQKDYHKLKNVPGSSQAVQVGFASHIGAGDPAAALLEAQEEERKRLARTGGVSTPSATYRPGKKPPPPRDPLMDQLKQGLVTAFVPVRVETSSVPPKALASTYQVISSVRTEVEGTLLPMRTQSAPRPSNPRSSTTGSSLALGGRASEGASSIPDGESVKSAGTAGVMPGWAPRQAKTEDRYAGIPYVHGAEEDLHARYKHESMKRMADALRQLQQQREAQERALMPGTRRSRSPSESPLAAAGGAAASGSQPHMQRQQSLAPSLEAGTVVSALSTHTAQKQAGTSGVATGASSPAAATATGGAAMQSSSRQVAAQKSLKRPMSAGAGAVRTPDTQPTRPQPEAASGAAGAGHTLHRTFRAGPGSLSLVQGPASSTGNMAGALAGATAARRPQSAVARPSQPASQAVRPRSAAAAAPRSSSTAAVSQRPRPASAGRPASADAGAGSARPIDPATGLPMTYRAVGVEERAHRPHTIHTRKTNSKVRSGTAVSMELPSRPTSASPMSWRDELQLRILEYTSQKVRQCTPGTLDPHVQELEAAAAAAEEEAKGAGSMGQAGTEAAAAAAGEPGAPARSSQPRPESAPLPSQSAQQSAEASIAHALRGSVGSIGGIAPPLPPRPFSAMSTVGGRSSRPMSARSMGSSLTSSSRPTSAQVFSATGVPSKRVRPPSAGVWAGRPLSSAVVEEGEEEILLGEGWDNSTGDVNTLMQVTATGLAIPIHS